MSTSVLSQASREWASRPSDESYMSLQELHQAALGYKERAREAKHVYYADLRVEPVGDDLKLFGPKGIPADFTHWSFGQLSARVGAPTDWCREVPAPLAAENLNYAIQKRGAELDEAKLLLDVNGHSIVRAFTGIGYTRIWNADITRRALTLEERGWSPAPETELANGGKTRGLYKSNKDVFLFLVDNARRVFEKAPGGGLSRGVMIANSEVGDKSFWCLTFLYSYVCANHNVWGVEGVNELRIRHVGDADERAFGKLAPKKTGPSKHFCASRTN